ncbi:MAG: metallophosphoesterase [Leptospirales bacterium]|nr:metallophosphoesterase [Leptospirales bacterium]
MREQWLRFVIFLSVLTCVLGLGYAFVAMRLTAGFNDSTWKLAIWLIVGFFLVLTPLTFAFRLITVPEGLQQVVSWVSYMAFGFFAMLLTLLLLRDLGLVAVDQGMSLIQNFKDLNLSGHILSQDRRQLLIAATNLVLFGTAGGMFGYGLFRAVKTMDTVHVRVPIRDLPDELVGFRIVQITDIHIGPTIKRAFAESVVERVNSLSADIVAVTGDVVDGSVEQLREHTAPFAGLSSRYGTFFVTGNHDYYSGCMPWLREFSSLGFKPLLNEHAIIHHNGKSIMLAGVTDFKAAEFYRDHTSDPHRAMRTKSPHSHKSKKPNDVVNAKVLLAHQPRSIHGAAAAGFDLQISGHTHGGQFFPGPYLVKLQQPYVKGLHLHKKKTWIYISRGTGYWGPPIRVGSPPEISVIELARA